MSELKVKVQKFNRTEKIAYVTFGFILSTIIYYSIVSILLFSLEYLKLILILFGGSVALITALRIDDIQSYFRDFLIGISFIIVVIGASIFTSIFFIVLILSIISITLIISGKHLRLKNSVNIFTVSGVITTIFICAIFFVDFWLYYFSSIR